jgi:hypothetical protein
MSPIAIHNLLDNIFLFTHAFSPAANINKVPTTGNSAQYPGKLLVFFRKKIEHILIINPINDKISTEIFVE